MNNNLKVDVFTSHGEDMLQTVVDVIRGTGAQYIRSGQKRVVWSMNDSSNTVYKIPYNLYGIQDNAVEVLFYRVLTELAQNGNINQQDLELFTRTSIVNNDLFKIEAERAKFIGSVSVSGQSIAKTVLSNYDWTNDYNRIQEILGEYFVAYDATIYNEPMNFGFINRNGRDRLVLLDAGSILPKVNLISNCNTRLTCPNCGGELRYRHDIIQAGNMNQIEFGAQARGGVYTCTTPNCSCNIEANNKTSQNTNHLDLYVYNSYLNQNKTVIDSIIAAYTGLYIPDTKGMGYGKYRQMFSNAIAPLGENTDDYRCLTAYALYIDHVGATLIAQNNQLAGNMIGFRREMNQRSVSYAELRSNVQNIPGVIPIISAWLYISLYLGQRDQRDDESWARFIVTNGDMESSVNRMRNYLQSLNMSANEQDVRLLCGDLVSA